MPLLDRWYFLLIAIVVYGGILVLAVWLVMWAIRISPRGVRSDNSLNLLRDRFARGEIDQQEYEARKAALKKP